MSLAKTIYQIPGPQGDAGTNGADGADGVNAFTLTTGAFTMPAASANVTVGVSSSDWAAIGQNVCIGDILAGGYIGTFEVVSKPLPTQIELMNLEDGTGLYANNVAPGTNVPAGKRVSPAGLQGPAGADGTSGADADAYYMVVTATDAPANAVNVGLLTTGLLKITVAVGVATPSTAVPGTDYQAVDPELTALAGLTSAADTLPYFTGAGTAALAGFTDAGRAILADPTAAAQLATLGAAAAGANADITSLAGLSTPLSVAQGGTGGATAADARDNLELVKAVADYIVIEEQQLAGVDGGTFTSGSWQLRALNTEVVDTGNHASVAASQITLNAGTYRCHAWATAYKVNAHKIALYDVTGATVLGVGSTEESAVADDCMTKSGIECRFTIAVQSVIQLRHQCETTNADDGYGEGYDFGVVEVYSRVTLWREAGP